MFWLVSPAAILDCAGMLASPALVGWGRASFSMISTCVHGVLYGISHAPDAVIA